MTDITDDVKRFHNERMEAINRQNLIVVPQTDCEQQNGLQIDFDAWKSDAIRRLTITDGDTLEDLFRKIMDVHSEAEKRRFLLTNILEGLKGGGKLSEILRHYREVGVGDVEPVTPPPAPSQPPAPAMPPPSATDTTGEAPGRVKRFFGWVGKAVAAPIKWAGGRSFEFVATLLEKLKELIGELILMVINVLKSFATAHPCLGLEAAIDAGATGPSFGFSFAVSRELNLDIISNIIAGICNIKRS